MGISTIDGVLLKRMIIAGANALERNKHMIDALNVFPVPDGDTGTNMSMTLFAAAREVEKLNTPNASDVMRAASGGSLRGARGNSGVIVSQLVRGFAKAVEGNALVTADILSAAFARASETAYKAVMKPKEGTILTLAREISEKCEECAYDTDDLDVIFREILRYGNVVLERTTGMLPELKQAGVVDAGGKGLLVFLEAAAQAVHTKQEIRLQTDMNTTAITPAAMSLKEIKFGYCTEFFINLHRKNKLETVESGLKKYLDGVGDSIVVVSDEELIKIHVHTNHPGAVLEYALKHGSIDNIKVENMRTQHSSLIEFTVAEEYTERKAVGFAAVAAGEGIVDVMTKLGVDVVIEGGQTMNPATEDILEAIARVNADDVFVLPNNKNIILAVQQAQELSANTNVRLIPTKTIPQGIAALVNYMPDVSPQDNEQRMREAIGSVKTGQVTYAVRGTKIEDKEIEEGDVLCMLDGKIESVADDISCGAEQLLERMLEDDGELVSIYYGADVSQPEAKAFAEHVSERWPDCEVELHYGAQPLYHYILSVE